MGNCVRRFCGAGVEDKTVLVASNSAELEENTIPGASTSNWLVEEILSQERTAAVTLGAGILLAAIMNCLVSSDAVALEDSGGTSSCAELEEKTMSVASTSTTAGDLSVLVTALVDSLPPLDTVARRDSGGVGSSAEPEEKTMSMATASDLSTFFTALVDSLPSLDLVAHKHSHDALSSSDCAEKTMSMATTSNLSDLGTALVDFLPSLDTVDHRDSHDAGPKSEYFSARVEEMMQTRSQFSSDVEHAIEYSKVHWSETTGLSGSSEIAEDQEWMADVDRENEQVFEELVKDPQWRRGVNQFLAKAEEGDVQLGRKLAEGGQAEIFEAIFSPNIGLGGHEQVLKVFKRGTCLSDLRKQWPLGIVQDQDEGYFPPTLGLMLTDRRFAFMMLKCRGDLRNLIDESMQVNNNRIPPFPYVCNGKTVNPEYIMKMIAMQMEALHKVGILHRDLKAANILVKDLTASGEGFVVADFECSLGVVGTGFWRAPEVLVLLQERKPFEFTEAMDVYSYGMLCYEIVTGRLPFESELQACKASYNLVITGRRPTLPCDVDISLKTLIERCWHPNPSERPNFSRIVHTLSLYHALKGRGIWEIQSDEFKSRCICQSLRSEVMPQDVL